MEDRIHFRKEDAGVHGRQLHEKQHRKRCVTAWYSLLHMLVDGACALAMFGRFLPQKEGYLYILLYNFCAFALQMPFGVVLDALNGRKGEKRDYAFDTAVTGVFCTVLGAFTHPVILGVGNALFHVGGGVGVMREDMEADFRAGCLSDTHDSLLNAAGDSLPVNGKSWCGQGRGLGIFVAPGALGLYLGTLAAKGGVWKAGFFGVSALMLFLCGILWNLKKHGGKGASEAVQAMAANSEDEKTGDIWFGCKKSGDTPCGTRRQEGAALILCCTLVVVLRSYIGMTAGFPWKTGIPAGILATLALVGGKMAGGFAAAGFGMRKTAVLSLAPAAVCYLLSAWMPVGLAAVFLFNMTMPVTLYWMACHMPDKPGFAFGILTFALFLGFLPVYLGLAPVMDGRITGCVGSLLSMALLAACMGRRRGWRDT